MMTPRSSLRRFWLPFSLAFAGLLAVSACKPSGPAAARAPQAVPVQVAKAEKRTLAISQAAIGTVQALRTVAVKSQVDGVIAQFHFREGDEVKAGDLLVTLDKRPFENTLRIARADLANARAEAVRARTDADRYRQLDQQSVVSKEQYNLLMTRAETTAALVQSKEASVANAELSLGYTEIRAPISGRTGQRTLHEGALVRANDASQSLTIINQQEPVAVAYSVPENTLPGIRRALASGPVPVVARLRNGGSGDIAGQLEFVDNAVDPTTGTILLKAVFPNQDHALWPGLFVDVVTRVGTDTDATVVPSVAIQVGQRGPQIFVLKSDGFVELRPVRVGRADDGISVILEGVQVGETVVTDGQLRLTPGAKAEPKALTASPAPQTPKGDAAKPAADRPAN